MKKIYLDYAATTPLDPKVFSAMLPYLKKDFGNASSIHGAGQKAREAVDNAREQVAGFLHCSASEIIFTGSATEADNLAIFGVIKAGMRKGIKKPHIITTNIEHHAVLELCQALGKEGAELTYLPVDKQGLVKAQDIEKALKPNTVLVSVMYANNEIGTIQPISKIGAILEKFKVKPARIGYAESVAGGSSKFKVIFHTDAVQAINYLDCNVEKLGVDLLTISGHKIYGPKGIGALYVRKGTALEPLVYGGGQERGLRSGTENVAGIVGLGAAIEIVQSSLPIGGQAKLKVQSLLRLRNKLIDGVLTKIPKSRLNGSRENRLPNNANFSFEGAEGESIVIALDQEGIAGSTGSACSSRSLEPSHVLLGLGLSREQAHGSLRLTLGRYTTEQEINRVLDILPKIIERLRKIAGRR